MQPALMLEITVAGIGLNSGCPPATPDAEVAFQGNTSFCAVATCSAFVCRVANVLQGTG